MGNTTVPALPNNNNPAPAALSKPQAPQAPDFVPSQAAANVKPDGGELGHAALGALTGATTAHAEQNAPPDFIPATGRGERGGAIPDFIPANGQTLAAPAKPGFWQQMENAENSGALNPLSPSFIVGGLHLYSGALANWANKKMQQDQENTLRGVAAGKTPSWLSPFKKIEDAQTNFDAGALRDTAGMAHDVTGPKGLTTLAASILAPIPTGLYMVGHGLYNMVNSWGDLANPDTLQSELGSAAEVVGGAALTGEGGSRYSRAAAAKKAAQAPDAQYETFKKGAPPSKAAPYDRLDFDKAKPYIQAEIKDTSVTGQMQAANDAIEKIENDVGAVVKANPDAIVTNDTGNHVDVFQAVKNSLGGSVRASFLDTGLKELDDIPQLKDPAHLTLQDADDIRKQLNTENSAMMKSKNNYDFAQMLNTDPAFAARNAAAEALRSGIYNTLQKLGLPDAQSMRATEGSIIKVRNAMLRQEFAGEKPVRPPASKMSKTKAFVKRSLGPLGAAFGFEIGAKLGHPVMGAGAGARAGEAVGEMLEPKYLTRDQLVEKAFEKIPQATAPTGIAATGILGEAGQQEAVSPYNHIHIRDSNGREFFIPSAQLTQAYRIDPSLQIIK